MPVVLAERAFLLADANYVFFCLAQKECVFLGILAVFLRIVRSDEACREGYRGRLHHIWLPGGRNGAEVSWTARAAAACPVSVP